MEHTSMGRQSVIRVAVLGSTRGTDLQGLLMAQASGKLRGAEIVTVISNEPEAGIVERARQAGVEALIIPSQHRSRAEFEQKLLAAVQERKIDLIVLIGFMRILSADFVEQYPNRIMNIHPSLLPKYAGGMNMDVHAEVLKSRDKVTGCTLHYVTANVDSGPIILQKQVPVLADDTPGSLKERVQAAEQEALLEGINTFASQRRTA